MSERKKTVGIYTLGCKVNQYESEAIAKRCAELGLSVTSPEDICGAYIINTCTVTQEADRKARQFIRRAISRNPEAYIIVTGCFSQINPDAVAAILGVDYICGNTSKLSAADATAELIASGAKKAGPVISVHDINRSPFEPMSISSYRRTRAVVKIEDGCESRCTYCIIPAARGKIRSKPVSDVVSEVRALTEGGCREVVLTGIETAAYGRDLHGSADLASLLLEIDKIDGIGRVRLGSLDPSLFRPEFIERISGLKSLAPHFHLSMQSGSDRVLNMMKRRYSTAMAARSMELIRQAIPGVQFTADMIVGFPQESDSDFLETLDFVRAARFLSVHVFAYSRRAGTPAAAMAGQIPPEIKSARSAELISVEREIRRSILDGVVASSPLCEVLFETYDGKRAFGHTGSFIEVSVPSDVPLHSEIKTVKLAGHDGEVCSGCISD
jgi:threonylcarbamoyladenosine tRNA methylthiotransferase MtaB